MRQSASTKSSHLLQWPLGLLTGAIVLTSTLLSTGVAADRREGASAPSHELRDVTIGTIRATRWGITSTGPCMGYVQDTPNYVLHLDEPMRVQVRVRAVADTTLVIIDQKTAAQKRPSAWCNDDADGSNPGVQTLLPAGDYAIYVGSWESDVTTHFSMTIDLSAPSAPR